jgi:hypothetical protein
MFSQAALLDSVLLALLRRLLCGGVLAFQRQQFGSLCALSLALAALYLLLDSVSTLRTPLSHPRLIVDKSTFGPITNFRQ